MELDELDVAIVCALLEDARASNREIARKVASSPTTVGQRLDRLTKRGLVTGATLRLEPALLPGHARVATGRVRDGQTDTVLEVARRAPGVVEAVATTDGRFIAVLQIVDLEQEERILRELASYGLEDTGVQGARRAQGPAPVHLFAGKTGVKEPCAVCGKQVESPLEATVDDRRVVFCCPSCKRIYMERYEELARKAGRE